LDAVQHSLNLKLDTELDAFTFDEDFDAASLPKRPWIIKGVLLRGYVTAGIAPPGVGKSTFAAMTAIMVATGWEKPMLNRPVLEKTNVLLLNNEDDEDELKRKISGICQHYDIGIGELTDRLFVRSGYGSRLLLAHRNKDNMVVATVDNKKVLEFCLRHSIGLIIIDPFISVHDVPENDNTDIESVITEIRSIAKQTGAAVLLIHHTKKTGGDSEQHAGDTEAGRGASSLIGAARISFTLARMSKQSALDKNIDWNLGNRLIRMDDGKINFALRSEKEDWYEMKSVQLPNGDSVGVPEPFDMADIEKRKAKEKEVKKDQDNADRLIDIVRTVADCMTEESQPQPEVVSAYMTKKDIRETASKEAVKMIPVGRKNAISVSRDKIRSKVWRERIGTANQPRYTIHREIED
jgi:RecA-family ATPase